MIIHDDIFIELGSRFERAGETLFLVGGSVRDMVLGRDVHDWDFTTSAMPNAIQGILGFEGWADAIWDIGKEFGTIAARKDGLDIEITTMRHDGPGRKPEVVFTDSLEEDLIRRDFTINTLAIQCDSAGMHGIDEVIDPFGGIAHLKDGVLDTPRTAEESFSDDPLRMMRAARFVSQLGLKPSRRVELAMLGLRGKLRDVSAERIVAEMDKLLMGANPERGLSLLLHTRLIEVFLPELNGVPAMLRGLDVDSRWADLMRDVDPMLVQNRLRNGLKSSGERVRNVGNLVAWVQRFSGVSWADSEPADVRRVLAATGGHLEEFKALMDDDSLNARLELVLAEEGHPEPFLSGKEIIEVLGIKPGPIVGDAQRFLWGVRLDFGPQEREVVEQSLRDWASA